MAAARENETLAQQIDRCFITMAMAGKEDRSDVVQDSDTPASGKSLR